MTSTPISWARTRAECERATRATRHRSSTRARAIASTINDGTHAREHARSTTSARARIVESSPSARAISLDAGARRDDGDARQRQRARGDRDDDGARATRRAMDARANAGGRGKRARGFGWDRRARSGARDAGEEGRGGVGIAARALLSTNPRGGARTGTGEGRARDDGEG